MAEIWAKNSYCKRRQVGALLVKNNMIISDGYNGTPSGFENVCEENGVTKPYVLHAEANAISKIAKSGNSAEGSILLHEVIAKLQCESIAQAQAVLFQEGFAHHADGAALVFRR